MSIGAPNRAGRLYKRFQRDAYRLTKATNPASTVGFLQRQGNPTNKQRDRKDGVGDPYQSSMNYFNYFRGLRNGG